MHDNNSENASTSGPSIVMVAPTELQMTRNIRDASQLTGKSDPLVASIKEVGVLQPIVAVRDATGALVVRMGHRRTVAACLAGIPQVPVIVVGDESTDAAGEIERIVGQFAENEHRVGLTNTDRLGVVETLSGLGESAAKIARRTRMPRDHVDAALTVATSATMHDLVTRDEEPLDLLTAAALAEFEDDPETFDRLAETATARPSGFPFALQRARDRRTDKAARDAVVAELSAAGVSVFHEGRQYPLDELTSEPGGTTPLTIDGHAKCPGHGAWLEQEFDEDEDSDTLVWVPVYGCNSPQEHGHHPIGWAWPRAGKASPTGADDAEAKAEARKEAVRAERRRVIENNKAWRTAETVRRDWLATFLSRKQLPKGGPSFLAAALTYDAGVIGQGHALAAEWVGAPESSTGRGGPDFAGLIERASDARRHVLSLAVALAGYENETSVDSWRYTSTRTGRYLSALAMFGYTLSPVERLAAGLPETEDDEQPPEDVASQG